jgi:hypothetical protein
VSVHQKTTATQLGILLSWMLSKQSHAHTDSVLMSALKKQSCTSGSALMGALKTQSCKSGFCSHSCSQNTVVHIQILPLFWDPSDLILCTITIDNFKLPSLACVDGNSSSNRTISVAPHSWWQSHQRVLSLFSLSLYSGFGACASHQFWSEVVTFRARN